MSALLQLNLKDLQATANYLKKTKSKHYTGHYTQLKSDTIAINNENGYSYRTFTRDVYFIRTNEYKSV